jgi:hypothetical protein
MIAAIKWAIENKFTCHIADIWAMPRGEAICFEVSGCYVADVVGYSLTGHSAVDSTVYLSSCDWGEAFYNPVPCIYGSE